MGAVGGMLGLGGGAGGTGFSAPETGANVQSTQQAAQDLLGQQKNFANALNPYAINAAASQQQLMNQLQQGAQGQGPNPALAQLAQSTGQNTANQAALMAGQRGAAANPALIARQAAMQGAANQQQAAGQAATLSAQQQLAQQQQLAAQQAQMVGQGQTSLNSAQNAANQIYGTASGMQSNLNSANAGLAGQAMGNQAGMIGGLMNSAGGALSSLLAEGGQVRQHYATGTPQVMQYQDIPAGSSPFDQQQAPAQMPAAPIAAPMVPKVAKPTVAQPPPQQPQVKQPAQNFSGMAGSGGANALYKGMSSFGNFLANKNSPSVNNMSDDAVMSDQLAADNQLGVGGADNKETEMSASNDSDQMMAAKGGKVPAMVSPGERYLKPSDVEKVKKGANPMQVGEKIPGKPVVGGAKNSYQNDTVPKTLDEGGIVLPRSVTQAKHPHWEAMKFVRAHMAKGGLIKPPNKVKIKK